MRVRLLKLLLAWILAGTLNLGRAVELDQIERRLRAEPAYATKTPKYCLLVFGPTRDYRVWLVLDGATLYVDRNGNGDLTEPGESTRPKKTYTDPASFEPITLLGADGKSAEKLEFHLYGWFGSWDEESGPCI
jgi:hypothetical protein